MTLMTDHADIIAVAVAMIVVANVTLVLAMWLVSRRVK
jgi:hypothetical protein